MSDVRTTARALCVAIIAVGLLFLRAGDVRASDDDGPAVARRPDVFGGYTSTQIVVRFRAAALPERNAVAAIPWDADVRAALSANVRALSDRWKVSRTRRAISSPFRDPALAARYGLDRTFIIEVPAGTDTLKLAADFAQLRDDVELATVDTIGGIADLIPSDPNFPLQWAMHNTGQTGGTVGADIDAPGAWELHTGDLGTVTIAIIDSGVRSHSEYGSNAPPYPNGRIVEGRNTGDLSLPTYTNDNCPHGTHVAGIAAAAGNNGFGVVGVNWGAYIMPVRVLLTDQPCNGYVSALADGIVWAADHGADVANMSLQYYSLTSAELILLQSAIDYAHDQGMILIAAAGNNNSGGAGVVAYPARLPNCMGVSGTTAKDEFADITTTASPTWRSNYGPQIDVSAPGDDIYSTWTSNSFTQLVGTSMAAPHVSGLAALLRSFRPALTNEQIRMILELSSKDLGAPGWDDHFGHGRINARQALALAMSEVLPEGPVADASAADKNRALALRVPPPATAGMTMPAALRLRMIELQQPDPPNAPSFPPPDYTAFQYGPTCADPSSCVRWVGPPGDFLESQDDPTKGSFRAARLQCTPYYIDWTAQGVIHVVGAEVAPSSLYEVQSVSSLCTGNLDTCTLVSAPLPLRTARFGDVIEPYNPPSAATQPDGIDVAAMVDKFKNVPGAASKTATQLQPDLPDLLADMGALDVSACVDAFNGRAYPFQGPCVCPSLVTCDSTACGSDADCGDGLCVKTCTAGPNVAQPCRSNAHCPSGFCSNAYCRDRCGRCTP